MKLSGWCPTCVSCATAVANAPLLNRDPALLRRLLLEPRVERGLGLHGHVAAHSVMARPAELCARDRVGPGLIRREPDPDGPARHRIQLRPKVRDDEAVD